MLAIIILGIVPRLGGVLLVLSMAIVGVGITGTLQMGVMLAAIAVLGRIVLGERVTRMQIASHWIKFRVLPQGKRTTTRYMLFSSPFFSLTYFHVPI